MNLINMIHIHKEILLIQVNDGHLYPVVECKWKSCKISVDSKLVYKKAVPDVTVQGFAVKSLWIIPTSNLWLCSIYQFFDPIRAVIWEEILWRGHLYHLWLHQPQLRILLKCVLYAESDDKCRKREASAAGKVMSARKMAMLY